MRMRASGIRQIISMLVAPLACAGLAGAMLSHDVYAQEPGKERALLPSVEVTGSMFRDINAQEALPITVLSADDIRATGATTTVDLVRKLTAAQGSTSESSAVGIETKGFAGISIHNIGETRTLVLLNGRRLTQFGGQELTGDGAGFDLNAIPLSAIAQVKLLTDGASAQYGADAIGGVVNLITKRELTAGEISLGLSSPSGGARETRLSALKGFGLLNKDKYNVMLSFSHDDRTALKSSSRSFARTGNVGFTVNGQRYLQQRLSADSIPANIENQTSGEWTSAFLAANGVCPPRTIRVPFPSAGTYPGDDYCGFDVIGELEIYPERKRDNFMLSAVHLLGEQELYADVLLGRTRQISRLAPATGNIYVAAGSALHNQYLLPLGFVDDAVAKYRLFDLGKRTNTDTADFRHMALGSRGNLYGWEYDAVFGQSVSDVTSNISGYPGTLAVQKLADSGLLDPFVGPGQQSAAAQAAISGINYNGLWKRGIAKLTTLNLSGTRPLMEMEHGSLKLGAGMNINRESFESRPSLFAQGRLSDPVAGTVCDPTVAGSCDQRFGDPSQASPYSASRISSGVFGELLIPVTQSLELTTSARVDHYSDFGSATTGKASFRWTPTPSLLLRGSIGNGFRAPTVPQIKAALQGFGVTGDRYACSADLQAVATAQGAICQPGRDAYDMVAGGNTNLQPERSKQATLGVRYQPTGTWSLGADLWHVQLSDRIGQLTEQVVFANPLAFPTAWTSRRDLVTGNNFLAFLVNNQNLGKSFSTGLDLNFAAPQVNTAWGKWTSQLTLTYLLREVSQLEKGGAYYSAVGNFAQLGTVSFRTQGRLASSLKSGDWTHTLAANFKSGYRDQETTVNIVDAAGTITGTQDIRVHAGTYATIDWQSSWAPAMGWTVSAGALNLFNRAPPFVASISGTNRGQQFGYDDRYYDARGRTIYVNASYKF